MQRHYPPLSTLHAFRSAAHCLSFTLAAQELSVTQAAISHQIKSLESSLEQRLFVRGNRSLQLSDAGKHFLPYVDQIFATLEEGLDHLANKPKLAPLTVSLLPSFASRWLVPRLGLFLQQFPEVDFRLAPSRGLTNFATENIDISIRYGSGNYPGLTSIHLLEEDIYPVCCPSIMQGKHPLLNPSDLKHHVLLHDDGHGDWHKWLVEAKASDVDSSKGPVYTDSAMAVQSALEGDGIALARSQLVLDDLAKGRLIRPFDISQPTGFSYFIVYPEEQIPNTAMRAFIGWLQQQARESEIKYRN
ncbi:MAG: LysR family glycine cleavage system transcriptional activator [Saprospiraceae bacterium]|jgi:LysR family glycine cleavage system transcriptional activator